MNRAVREIGINGPMRSERASDLATLAAACGTVADRRSGATAAVVVLGVGLGADLLTEALLAPLEQHYGVCMAVLDEGSPTTAPTVRITRASQQPVAGERRLGQGGALAWLRRWLAANEAPSHEVK